MKWVEMGRNGQLMTAQSNRQLEQRLIDELELSPMQKYSKYKKFPWALITTLCLVFVSTIFVQAQVLGRRVQQRNIQVFFNYHILQHKSFDIYEADDVFTYRTQQYIDFQDFSKFFVRTIQLVSNLNQYSFYQTNQTHTDTVKHSVVKYTQRHLSESKNMSLQEINSEICDNIKEYMEGVKRIEVTLHINNMTLNVKDLDLLIQIEVIQKLQTKVTLDIKCNNFTLVQDNREANQNGNLQIRKIPSHHHMKYSPYNVGFFFRVALILLSFQVGIKRVMMYNNHPFPIRGVSEGEDLSKLSLIKKCKIMGFWQIAVILLNILGIIQTQISVFTAWVQIVRYLEYTQNPYILTLLTKNILRLLAVVILTVFFVLTGFVLLSMVLFTYSNKFESTKRAYFSYLFNNFQYGIYENFIALGRYGGTFQCLYFVFCFYMVWCTNNIVPSILCNTVINKNRLRFITKFFREIRIPCPVCNHITNQQAYEALKKTYSQLPLFTSKVEQTEVQMKIYSPKILPFLSPKLLPAARTSIRQSPETQLQRPKRTVFQIKEELDGQSNVSNSQLFRLKIQLLRKKIEQSQIQLDIFGGKGHNKYIKQTLILANTKVNFLRIRTQKRLQSSQTQERLRATRKLSLPTVWEYMRK